MRRAVALARRGLGRTRPNPVVGCVIERDCVVVGEGWHRLAGGPHAEADALTRLAGKARGVRGATAHVTLEPCDHTGKTTACTDALIAAGIARVVYACADPVHGGGAAKLRAAGMQVDHQPHPAAAEVNEAWLVAAPRGRPFLALKTASSLDGRIATASGSSQWITGPAARRAVHGLRSRYDAVLVGSGTLRADDPQLTARFRGARQPVRVALDARMECPADARILSDEAPTWLVAGPGAPDPPGGAEALVVPVTEDGGRLDLKAMLEALWARDIVSVLCEGGGILAGALLAAGLVDRLYAFVAPVFLGADGAPMVAMNGPDQPGDGLRLHGVRRQFYGDDVLITGRLT